VNDCLFAGTCGILGGCREGEGLAEKTRHTHNSIDTGGCMAWNRLMGNWVLQTAHGCNGSAMQSSVTIFALEIMSDILFSIHFTMRHFSG
jgi:hypothetical protein